MLFFFDYYYVLFCWFDNLRHLSELLLDSISSSYTCFLYSYSKFLDDSVLFLLMSYIVDSTIEDIFPKMSCIVDWWNHQTCWSLLALSKPQTHNNPLKKRDKSQCVKIDYEEYEGDLTCGQSPLLLCLNEGEAQTMVCVPCVSQAAGWCPPGGGTTHPGSCYSVCCGSWLERTAASLAVMAALRWVPNLRTPSYDLWRLLQAPP